MDFSCFHSLVEFHNTYFAFKGENMKSLCENCNKETADFIGATFSEPIGAVPNQYKTSVVFVCGECRAVKRVV